MGPRQVGKTTAARQVCAQWKGPTHMVSADGPTPPDTAWIELEWHRAQQKGPGSLLVIDEIQKIPRWSEQIKRLYDDPARKSLHVLLLGSSSLYLQRGLGESLAGRFEIIPAPHWSFGEWERAFGEDFEGYLRHGAYPAMAELQQDEARWRQYVLQSIIEPVLGKDILGQQSIGNPALFRQTFELAVQCPAHIVSLQKLLGQLQDRGSVATIRHYLELFEQCFLLRVLHKYSGSIVQTRSSIPKIVILNAALTHAYQTWQRLSTDQHWYGFVFESAVGAHLAQVPNSQLYYWREGRDEVDYVLKTPAALYAIEVKSGRTIRTQRGLAAFARKFPKARCETWEYSTAIAFMRGQRTLE